MPHVKVERVVAGRLLSFETGKIARQAPGSVWARYGDSVVLCTACQAPARPGLDFFPLSVEYREKTYAAGKFPGGFLKREGRPKDKEILTCRLIDRPIRPLWPEGYKDEVQVIATVVSAEPAVDPDVVAMNGCFAALHASSLPFQGPIAAVRVGRVDGQWIAFPTPSETDDGDVEILVAASRDAIVMVEGEAQEISEAEFLEALDFGRGVVSEILDMMDDLRRKADVPESTWTAPVVETPDVYHAALENYERPIRKAMLTQGKHERYAALKALRTEIIDELLPSDLPDREALKGWVKKGLEEAETRVVRRMIVRDKKRIDERGPRDIRPITGETGVLPRTHGSALFTRGETQALVIVTLGTPRDQQIVDGLLDEYAKRFDLQYNFPPFSVGEVKPMRGVGRREIGHGNLAERAVAKVIPSEDRFPYTIRVVSEITESNGSSSMATVCGATLALMDAGVTIAQPVAGIAMGLIVEGNKVEILSDILGTEDHLGDMDFKVAGTGRGITAVQMDIKIKGLSREVMARALDQAREGRLHILREMLKAMTRPRAELSRYAPRLIRISIPVEKIGLVIGPGGNNIKKLQEETGATVEIEDDGTVIISAVDGAAGEAARQRIQAVTAEVEIGRVYDGRVVSIKDFGAFVEVLPGQEGLCHVSELSNRHVRDVSEVVRVGDRLKVKVVLRDEQGRLKLSHRAVLDDGANGDGGERDRRDESRPPVGRPSERAAAPGADRAQREERPVPVRDERPRRDEAREERPVPVREERPVPVRDERPRRDEARDERPRRDEARDERPRRDEARDERPRRDEARDERPRRAEARDERPRRDEARDERPRRDEARDERPRRDEARDERPRRDEARDERPRRDEARDERPRRDEARDERPRRDEARDERPRRDEARDERPRRDEARDERPRRDPDQPLRGGRADAEPAPRGLRSSAEENVVLPTPAQPPADAVTPREARRDRLRRVVDAPTPEARADLLPEVPTPPVPDSPSEPEAPRERSRSRSRRKEPVVPTPTEEPDATPTRRRGAAAASEEVPAAETRPARRTPAARPSRRAAPAADGIETPVAPARASRSRAVDGETEGPSGPRRAPRRRR